MGTAAKMHDEIEFQKDKEMVLESRELYGDSEFYEWCDSWGIDDLTPYLGDGANNEYMNWIYLHIK